MFDDLMDELGYDKDDESTVGSDPAAVGNRIGNAWVEYGLNDGANEGPYMDYADDGVSCMFSQEQAAMMRGWLLDGGGDVFLDTATEPTGATAASAVPLQFPSYSGAGFTTGAPTTTTPR